MVKNSTIYIVSIILCCTISSLSGLFFELLSEIETITTVLTKINERNRTELINFVKEKARNSSQNIFTTDIQNILAFPTKGNIFQQDFPELAGQLPQDVTEIVEFLENPARFTNLGARMPKGILLVGPPGTGKTTLARYIANTARASFFSASASQFIQEYVGVGPKRIRELFDEARQSIKNGPYKASILFIDEIDAIGNARDPFTNTEYRNTLNELLNQMDGFHQDPTIVVIAATNNHKLLDPALTRPGRFDRIVKVTLPSYKDRKEILEHYTAYLKINIHEYPIDFDFLATKTEGYSGAELKNLVNEAAIRAAREKAAWVQQKHFVTALHDITIKRSNK